MPWTSLDHSDCFLPRRHRGHVPNNARPRLTDWSNSYRALAEPTRLGVPCHESRQPCTTSHPSSRPGLSSVPPSPDRLTMPGRTPANPLDQTSRAQHALVLPPRPTCLGQVLPMTVPTCQLSCHATPCRNDTPRQAHDRDRTNPSPADLPPPSTPAVRYRPGPAISSPTCHVTDRPSLSTPPAYLQADRVNPDYPFHSPAHAVPSPHPTDSPCTSACAKPSLAASTRHASYGFEPRHHRAPPAPYRLAMRP